MSLLRNIEKFIVWKNSKKFTLAAFTVMGAFIFAAPANAETLYESLQVLVKNQKQIKAAEADLEAAKERGAWRGGPGIRNCR